MEIRVVTVLWILQTSNLITVIYKQQSWEGKVADMRDVKQGQGRPCNLGGRWSSHRTIIPAKLEGCNLNAGVNSLTFCPLIVIPPSATDLITTP